VTLVTLVKQVLKVLLVTLVKQALLVLLEKKDIQVVPV
jgi:hypothetical protein